MKTWPTTLLPSRHSAFHTSIVSLTMSSSHLAPHAVESKCKCTKIIRLLQSLSFFFFFSLLNLICIAPGAREAAPLEDGYRWPSRGSHCPKGLNQGLWQMFKKNKHLYIFVIGFKSACTACEGLCSYKQTRRELSPNPAVSRSSAERLSTAQYWFFWARDFSVLARSHCAHQPHF